jgi:hypothetical protein
MKWITTTPIVAQQRRVSVPLTRDASAWSLSIVVSIWYNPDEIQKPCQDAGSKPYHDVGSEGRPSIWQNSGNVATSGLPHLRGEVGRFWFGV